MNVSLKQDLDTRIIGRIDRPRGLKGEVFVSNFFNDDICLYTEGRDVFVNGKKYRVKYVKPLGKRLAVRFDEIGGLEEAELLRGAYIAVRREGIAPLKEGEYYYSSLIGCVLEDREGRKYGVIRSIIRPYNLDILRVYNYGEELLVPLLDAYIHDINVKNKKIIFDPACLP